MLILRPSLSLQILFKCPTPAACHRFWKCYKTLTFCSLLTRCIIPYACRANIWTSKSGPNMWCFEHFDLEMCFPPQRRALFRHVKFQKCSEVGMFCTCLLRNLLRATTACAFSTSQLPKVFRTWGDWYILTWKCASCHNGVHFFDIWTSKSGPNPWCF